MNMFINLIQSNKITNGCFWEDYAYVAYFCQMFLHTVSALDSAKKYLQKESRYEEIFGRKLRNKFHYPDVNDTLDVKNLWSIIHEDSMATFISIPLGYKISIPIHWKILPLSYFNRIAGLNFKLSPYMGYMGEITTNISIITHVPAKDESLDDYMKKFLKTTFSFEQVDLQLSLNEKSYIGINQYLYEDEGGAKVIVLGFERSEPVNRLSILEKPQSLNPSTNGFSAYRLNRDTLYYRFPGKLQYVILLDCCNSIFTMVFEDFKAALKTFVVE